MSDWKTYYAKHLSRPVRPRVVKALALCKNKGVALDLGAGTLVETKYLLEAGFKKVVAVDSSPEIIAFANELQNDRLQALVSTFQDLTLTPGTYDFITAQYALPFHGPAGFKEFFGGLVSSLTPGGVFTAQLFGEKDGWNTPDSKLAFHTKEEVEELLQGLEIKDLEEEEKDAPTAAEDQKHWHVFHFTAVKRVSAEY